MKRNQAQAVKNIWNHASVVRQNLLIRRYIAKYGRADINQDDWLQFLAVEFDVMETAEGSAPFQAYAPRQHDSHYSR